MLKTVRITKVADISLTKTSNEPPDPIKTVEKSQQK
jgi:hypothetical protein